MKDQFIAAIHARAKVRLQFFSKEDDSALVRVCAPMDYGPGTKARDGLDRFHFWDYESDTKPHPLSLLPEKLIALDTLVEAFDPAEFVTWQPNWTVPRHWGIYS